LNAAILICIDLVAKQEDPARRAIWKADPVNSGLIHAEATFKMSSFATSLNSC